MKKIILLLLFMPCFLSSYSQYKQTIRGVVIDQASKVSLPGANVSVKDGDKTFGTTTNEKGEFEFSDIPIDRYELTVSFMGYEAFYQKNLDLGSGKEKVLTIELAEKVEKIDEIIVTASGKGEAMNEMAALSARSFTVAETERYAGSWGDPSRMASNFAGVITANDSRNDIIIRGNSSLGLLWKLDGVSIPNPNHFGALGTTGGPVSMLNNNMLTNSDFFTGAFPAEYGNALSGVFDLKMRHGNNRKHEFLVQMGFSGLEVGAEGPISKKAGASYLINYRYSIPGLMGKVFDFGGGVPNYQDLSMKIYFPTKKAGTFSLFAIDGNSSIVFDDIENGEASSYTISDGVRTCNSSEMGVVGLTHRIFPDNKSNIFTTFSMSLQGVNTQIDTIYSDNSSYRFYGEGNREIRTTISSKYTRKINAKNTIKAGASLESFTIDYADSVSGLAYNLPKDQYINNLDTHENGLNLLQAFAEWQHKFGPRLTAYGGLHYQHFFFNNTQSFNPRLNLSYKLSPKSKVSLAYGMHSQLQPLYIYFTETYDTETGEMVTGTNHDLDFTNSQHIVAGYDRMLYENFKLKIESYYQYLTDVPVSKENEYFSMLNEGNTFHQSRMTNLLNEGIGRNYGVELTFEKYLSNNYYFLLTTSLFDSKYKGSDDVWRNTEFNTNYLVNVLGGYQIPLSQKLSLDVNLRVLWSGGKRDYYIDLDKSVEHGTAVYDFSKTFNEREKDYFKLDGRISLKLNGKKVTQEWAFDITNATNHKNIYSKYYDNESKSIKYTYQQGLYPMFLYRINF
ncbi:MAG: TonB-dependent receptor [Prolixibacteraceae bacterium]|nr:TonB-dependent receptor [Prolixibacteraceae bacterium]